MLTAAELSAVPVNDGIVTVDDGGNAVKTGAAGAIESSTYANAAEHADNGVSGRIVAAHLDTTF